MNEQRLNQMLGRTPPRAPQAGAWAPQWMQRPQMPRQARPPMPQQAQMPARMPPQGMMAQPAVMPPQVPQGQLSPEQMQQYNQQRMQFENSIPPAQRQQMIQQSMGGLPPLSSQTPAFMQPGGPSLAPQMAPQLGLGYQQPGYGQPFGQNMVDQQQVSPWQNARF